MKTGLTLVLAVILVSLNAAAGQEAGRASALVLDEDTWVTFYDLPSRRFRSIRSALLTQQPDVAARDLSVSASYISVEVERTPEALQRPLQSIVAKLEELSGNVDKVTLSALDALFGRAHWLLAQHYLYFARQSRDAREDRNTSLYLWATAHHMERAMLWSNVPLSREVSRTLQSIRDIAGRLQNPQAAASAYQERPVVRAEELLRRIGEEMDRRVLLPAAN